MTKTQIKPGDLSFSNEDKTIYDLIGKTIKNIEAIKKYSNDRVVVYCEDGTLFLLSSVADQDPYEYEYESNLELRKINKIKREQDENDII